MNRVRPVPSKQPLARQKSTNGEQATLLWCCWDKSKTVTTLAHEALKRWAICRDIQQQQRSMDEAISNTQPLGLAIWAGWESREVETICQSVIKFKEAHPQAVVVVFVAENCMDQASRLVQSGAHLVVHSLCDLQAAISRIAEAVTLSYQDTNRLTQGLVQYRPVRDPSHFRP